MRLPARFHASPALVVACVALLVGLGGTGIAAVALVPRNSVGSEQVIDGSLKSRDFRAGEVLQGSDVVSRSIAGPVPLTAGGQTESGQRVASLPITKPGVYMIWASAQVVTPTAVGGECDLFAHGIPNGAGGVPDVDRDMSFLESPVAGSTPTFWTGLIHGFSTGGGSVELECNRVSKSGLIPTARNVKITAVRLAD